MVGSSLLFGRCSVRQQAEAAQVDQNACLEQLLRRHRERPPARISAAKERSDPMRQGPHMQRHHQGRRPPLRGHACDQLLRGHAKDPEGALASLAQFGIGVERNAGSVRANSR